MAWVIERVAGPYSGEADGPVWDGEALLFSLVTESRILRYHPDAGRVVEYRKYTNNTRGLALAPEGGLFGCQGSARRVGRFNVDGTLSMLADRLDGRLHNQPYDLAVDRTGRIWFTDPEPPLRMMEPPVDHASVLRLDHVGGGAWVLKRMTLDTEFPMAIAFSKDERSLYVADNPRGGRKLSELRVYPLQSDDTLGQSSVLHSWDGFAVTGMCVTSRGNIVACLDGGKDGESAAVVVMSDTGIILEQFSFGPSKPTNCAFGGPGLKTLYVTSADGCLYKVRNFKL
ncbi:SMP-30/gluconolactonase/LRE family protein [Afipia sp. GAS231]|uniref:SMP-30/gluconolactonase/LRE family protein n=1 Tax=Afipia sp. GAS231 TaxID=1882747 RepID=UPI0012F7AFBC|nr:SMP-30/gluconolactonase/LRE family protein [Afipia sp. GAS231]